MVALWLLAGGAVGALNGLILWWTVGCLRHDVPGSAVAWVLAGAMLRWTIVAALLIGALQHGIVPGLLAFAGLWLARWGMVYWLGFGRALPGVLRFRG